MKTKSMLTATLAALACVFTFHAQLSAAPLGTAFSYQGRLGFGGNPANGLYDFRFALSNAVSGGIQLGPLLTPNAVGVTSGLFTVTLDFGPGIFTGDARWLAIGVKTNGAATYTALTPPQPLTPVPYAFYSSNAANAALLNGQSSAAFAPATGSSAYVAKGGDTMTGTLVVPANGLRAGPNQLVLAGGNVGIGITVPGERLDVEGGNILVRGPGSFNALGEQASLYLGDGNHYIRGEYGYGVKIGTWPAGDALCVTEQGSGSVGIGTTTPAQKLDVVGNIAYSGQLTRLDVADYVEARVGAADLFFGHSSRRGSPGRALVDFTDRLCVNFAADWPNTLVYGAVVLDPDNLNAGALSPGLLFGQGSGEGIASKRTAGGNQYGLDFYQAWQPRLSIVAGGNVGIGTTAPQEMLHVAGRARFDVGGGSISMSTPGGNPGLITYAANGHRRDLVFHNTGMRLLVSDSGSAGSVGIDVFENGTTSVKVLQITGGSDVAEPFELSRPDIPKGAVVVIDEENPGRLKMSDRAYDTRVAGIISGANGIQPGLTLSQQGVTDSGQNVALSGRVYAQADASHGPIKPGDLLTTSDVPGHAMKVTDHTRAQGAILGKAMSGLSEGRGMVLVLVSLQ